MLILIFNIISQDQFDQFLSKNISHRTFESIKRLFFIIFIDYFLFSLTNLKL